MKSLNISTQSESIERGKAGSQQTQMGGIIYLRDLKMKVRAEQKRHYAYLFYIPKTLEDACRRQASEASEHREAI